MHSSTDASPSSPPDHAAEVAALLEVHATDRRAHFETSVDLIMQHASDTFIAVSGGAIERQTRAEVATGFAESFRRATYFAWDDLEPPIIHISDDASMAWMIVRVRVRKSQVDAYGEPHERSLVYAGIMTNEKRDGRWLRVANVSTFA